MRASYDFTPSELPFYGPLEDGQLAIAHRGGDAANLSSADGPVLNKENSIAAFQSAWEAGVIYGETDAVSTADGQVLAFHGSRNPQEEARTGLRTRDEIQSMTLSEVERKVRIGGEPMPTMEELLVTFPDMRFFIDPKTKQVVRPLARLIDKLGAHDRVSIGAFGYSRTKGVIDLLEANKVVATTVGTLGTLALLGSANHLPGAKRYLLRSGISGFALPQANSLAELGIKIPPVVSAYRKSMPAMAEVAHELRMPLLLWTPNTADEINQALDDGVDGVMSDRTLLMKQAVDAHRKTA